MQDWEDLAKKAKQNNHHGKPALLSAHWDGLQSEVHVESSAHCD